jgi:hypothetical protein
LKCTTLATALRYATANQRRENANERIRAARKLLITNHSLLIPTWAMIKAEIMQAVREWRDEKEKVNG